MAFEPRIVASNDIAKTAPVAALYVATSNGEHVDTPKVHDSRDANPQGRMDRLLAAHLASTGRDVFADDRHRS